MKYICEFPSFNNPDEREYSVSAVNKARYIISVLNRIGYNVEVIAPTICKKQKRSRGRVEVISNLLTVFLCPSIAYKTRIGYYISHFFSKMWLFFYLIKHCKKGETLISYHGIMKIPFVKLATRIKKLKIVLEVEEIYNDTNKNSKGKVRNRLEKSMINKSVAYIFASKELATKYSGGKPYVIATGAYQTNHVLAHPPLDGKIHLIYAGLIETNQAAFKCLKIAKLLTEKYVMHIIGYGDENNIKKLRELIEHGEYNCLVVYDGFKTGEEYNKYLQRCHIGLCPLDTSPEFQEACFPSKITSYISNGLFVVTTENNVIRNSTYSSAVFFAGPNPIDFVNTISKIDLSSKNNGKRIVTRLDNEFGTNLKRCLNDLKGVKYRGCH